MTHKKRVVLSLNQEDAEKLNQYFLKHGGETSMLKIQQRVEKQLNKIRVLEEFEKQGVNPSKEQIKKAMGVLK